MKNGGTRDESVDEAIKNGEKAVDILKAGSSTSGTAQCEVAQTLSVTLQTMSGDLVQLPPLDLTMSVRDLATLVRSKTGTPISAQNLIWGTELLTDPSARLQNLFGSIEAVELTVVRRPFTAPERAQMYSRLVRAVAGGAVPEFRELLKEGAQPNFRCEASGLEASACLSHWEDLPESAGAAVVDGKEELQEQSEKASKSKSKEDSSDDEGDGDYCWNDSSSGDEYAVCTKGTCGGLTPLMMAVAVGEGDFAKDLRELGAEEVSMTPQHPTIAKAFQMQDFADVVKHVAAGADLNTRLRRGQGIAATNEGSPLHACAAMHSQPGAYEVAQLLIRRRADLSAGDTEGDTPLAHARYFRATEMFRLMQGHGAELRGPYYRRFGLR